MSYEEKDWILRQIKQIATGLGRMLSRESVMEIVNLEASIADSLTNEELDDILLLIAAEDKLTVSKEDISRVTQKRLNELMKDFSLLTVEERQLLLEYVNK